jgi:hypothetical protein
MRLPVSSLLLLLPLLAACSDDTAAEVTGPPGYDVTFTSSPFSVEAGSERTVCTYVRGENTEALDAVRMQAAQTEGGHHVIVYVVDHPIDLEPHDCPQGGQPDWSQVLASQDVGQETTFPPGVGFAIEPQQQYVIETHYINTSSSPKEGVTSSFSLGFAASGTVSQHAAPYFFGTQNIALTPGAKGQSGSFCSPPDDMTLLTMFGHEHRLGTGIQVGLTRAGGAEEPLYESSDWHASPITHFEGGLALGTADSLRVGCDWQNTGTDTVMFPHEMCYAIGMYYPARGTLMCATMGQKDECVCFYQGREVYDSGPGGSAVEVTLGRAADLANVAGDPSAPRTAYCGLYHSADWGPTGPKADAFPAYQTYLTDVTLKDENAHVVMTQKDVTPGDYRVFCYLDTVGGGFYPAQGVPVSFPAPTVTTTAGQTTSIDVTLNLALP